MENAMWYDMKTKKIYNILKYIEKNELIINCKNMIKIMNIFKNSKLVKNIIKNNIKTEDNDVFEKIKNTQFML